MTARRPWRVAACAGGGLLLGASYWPGAWFWAQGLALAPLLWVAWEEPPLRAFAWGWAFGACVWLSGAFWFWGTIERFLRLPPAPAACAFAGWCLYQGLPFALLAGGARWLSPAIAKLLRCDARMAFAAAAAALYVALESYFPWIMPLRAATALLAHLPAVQSADLFGTAAAAALVALVNAAVWLAAGSGLKGRQRWRPLAAALALALANEGYGVWRLDAVAARASAALAGGQALRVALLQGAVSNESRLDPRAASENVGVYAALTREALSQGPLDLVVWPETAYQRLIEWAQPARVGEAPLARQLREDLALSAPALLSAYSQDAARARFNSSLLVSAAGEVLGRYDKRLLFPFGEYVPLADRFPVLARFSPRAVALTPGRGDGVLVLPGARARLGVLVCYEAVVSPYAREAAAAGADVLVAQGDDGWFGRTMGAEQALRYVRLRAVEQRRFVLDAVQSGVSAVIDPTGRVVARLEAGRRGVLLGRIAPLSGPAGARLRLDRLALLLVILSALARLALGGAAESGAVTPP